MDLGIILLVIFMLVMIGGLAYMIYILFGKKKESEEDQRKYVPTTQDQLPIEYIRSGVVKLKTGGYRMIVELPSINIDLMEGSEKQTILEQYRQILNSIDFPFQYLQQSRIVDISDYLHTLKKIQRTTKSRFVQSQLEFYSTYLVDLIKNRSILTKKFYLVIPYDEEREGKNVKRQEYRVMNQKKMKNGKLGKEEDNDVYKEEQKFERAKKQLWIRSTMIERSFRRFEVNPKILNDKELLELYYTSYNKDRSVYQPLRDKDPADYTTLRVKHREEE